MDLQKFIEQTGYSATNGTKSEAKKFIKDTLQKFDPSDIKEWRRNFVLLMHTGEYYFYSNTTRQFWKSVVTLLVIAFAFTSCNRYFVPDPDNKRGKCKTPVYAAICDVDSTHVHLMEREVQKASKSLMH